MDKRSFDSKVQLIFNEVYDEFEGTVTERQIKDVYECIWSCVHHYSNLNDLVKIIIPKFGSFNPSKVLVKKLLRRNKDIKILDNIKK